MTGSVEVIAATLAQQPVIENLFQLYAHDFSEFLDMELNEHGRYVYSKLPLYWTDPVRHPFLIRVNGHLAGFALVSGHEGMWDMAEFFVARKYRHRGIGGTAARKIWQRFPGNWQVRVMQSNQPAQAFWQHTVPQPSSSKEEGHWQVFHFSV